MRLTVLTLIALALTVAAVTLNVPEMLVRLSMLATIALGCLKVLALLAGDSLYGKSADAKSGSKSSGELGSARN
jgi:hypothetical protein